MLLGKTIAEMAELIPAITSRECETMSTVIACDKREALAQGSEATKQSMSPRKGRMDWIASLRSQ